MKRYQMENEKFKTGLLNGLIVPSVGSSGGLAMLWSRDIKVEVQGYSRSYIDAVVTDPESGFKWRITGFYGNPKTHCRKESWDGSQELNSPMGIAARLRCCAENLSRWNKMVFGQIPKQIQEKRETLSTLVCRDRNGNLGSEINMLRKEINELLDSEEIKWHQISNVQWLGLGNRNTKYFRTRAPDRRMRNTISCIMDENGTWHDSIDDIAEVAMSYFKNIYSSSYPTRISEVLDTIPTKAAEEMNQLLIQEFTREEIEVALNQMHPTKAPGPDRMSAIFFQKYWGIVGNDVICMVLNVLNSNMSMVEINITNITLMPKTKSPTKMTDFRPISLCNIVYKLISKVLANRLKVIISQIISENQSAFLFGRLITDNVLVAFELMYYL